MAKFFEHHNNMAGMRACDLSSGTGLVGVLPLTAPQSGMLLALL